MASKTMPIIPVTICIKKGLKIKDRYAEGVRTDRHWSIHAGLDSCFLTPASLLPKNGERETYIVGLEVKKNMLRTDNPLRYAMRGQCVGIVPKDGLGDTF